MEKLDFLTTRELADLLRIKERKVYALAASGALPCSKATGKLLFPRKAVETWLDQNAAGAEARPLAERKTVFLGSHDPLLDWALRESRSGLATFFDGSFDGLERFAAGAGIATGLHIHEAGDQWNVATVKQHFAHEGVVLVEFAWRERGLVVAQDSQITSIAELRGRRVIPRQAEAGSQHLFARLLHDAGLEDSIEFCAPARSESDAALGVLEGKADAAFSLRGLARQYRLDFVPVIRERFDLLVDRHAWFEPPLQRLWTFCRSASFTAKAAELGGYDVSGFGRVVFNAS